MQINFCIKLFFTIILIASSTKVVAYSAKDIKLTPFEYSRWVRPQLNSISQDYKTLLAMMNPHLFDVKKQLSYFDDLFESLEGLKASCNATNSEKCNSLLTKYIEKIGKLVMASHSITLSRNDDSGITRENALHTFLAHGNYVLSLQDLYLQFINYKYINSITSDSIVPVFSMVKNLDEVYNKYNFYLLSNSDPRFFEAFTSFWNGFIRPIKGSILTENDKSHFIRKVNDMNLRWNIFHVELTKRNKQVSKPVESLLNTMHNRWKIVLRVMLR